MAVFRCKRCGGELTIVPGESLATCDYCGTQQTLPKVTDENLQGMFNRANALRMKAEFDKAAEIYDKILQSDGTEAEAYWGLILCKYGIEYVEDPVTHKRVPTCHRASYDAVTADDDYKMAMQYADTMQRGIYEEEAKQIDEIQKGIISLAQKETPYDVFICYKETDENGRRTQDSVISNDIYYQLTQEGYKVFYAAITLEDKLGQEYEPYIFSALNSARVMLSIGTKPEYFNAVWVKNEWSRFLKIMKKDRTRMLIPCYKDMDAYELPEEFAHLQAQDMSKIGFINDIVRGIKKVIVRESDTGHKADVNSTSLCKKDIDNTERCNKNIEKIKEDECGKIQKAKKIAKNCCIFAVIALAIFACFIVCYELWPRIKFDKYIVAGDKETNDELRQKNYIDAISVMPANTEAYIKLINTYKENDGKFTNDEADVLIGLVKKNQEMLKKNMNNYISLCYEIGKLYWFYYSYGNTENNQVTRMKSAISWFEDVVTYSDTENIDFEYYNIAKIFRDIGVFNRDYPINIQEIQETLGYSIYIEYFVRIKLLAEFVAECNENDEIVVWETYRLIAYSLETYMQKFKNEGLEDEVRILIDDVKNQVDSTEATFDATIELKKYIENILSEN